jgi:hypothetical protein
MTNEQGRGQTTRRGHARAFDVSHGKKATSSVAENRSDQELRIEAILPSRYSALGEDALTTASAS